MNYDQLDSFLYELTDLEAILQHSELSDEQIKERILFPDFPDGLHTEHSNSLVPPVLFPEITNPPAYNFTLANNVLKLNVTGDVFAISRHTRFVKMINHTHNLFEMNYIYSGTFYQEIQGERFELRQGDLIILNKDVEHSVDKVGKDAILINFLAKNEFFDNSFIYKILGDNILGKSIASILTNATRENKFLLFHTADHWQIRQTIQNILCETFGSKSTNPEIIKAYLTILFSRLLESDSYEMFMKKMVKTTNLPVVELLTYIDKNYLNMTLEQTAQDFGYSPEHLGRIIKKVTGKTFSALLQEQKFKHAALLIQMTDRTIEDISREIGYSNLTFFYKIFFKLYGITPKEYRRKLH
ncbi:AraC family transcriptional regulator [Paenibacillus sp. MMS20-IR301]|uniref:AraC family transcriptional regulator n=1 Tax=Paenibacillus sp. MMS20-IR301 TaxID=2895946 RepID=UPI0028E4A7C0|nr:AraC family transcriptional regulator [Paenibacillus sp. MMS20-IR301]WNS46041.1 AraC family transcriptional regulator [Paenibacillus sp. MMS20-IR301]